MTGLAKNTTPILEFTKDPARMADLIAHVLNRESSYDHFYCDTQGLVTVGAGYLVKTENDARALSRKPTIKFHHKITQKIATSDEVVKDWQRADDRYKKFRRDNKGNETGLTGGLRARAYAEVTELLITNGMIRVLLKEKIELFGNALYKAKPFLKYYDPYIAMALIDARYNPAGLHPWKKSSDMRLNEMWEQLNPCDESGKKKDKDKRKEHLEKAVKSFEAAWKNRGGSDKKRYEERHKIRVDWFQKGVEREQKRM